MIKKTIFLSLVLLLLAATVVAAGPGKSNNPKVEIMTVDEETWTKMDTGDGGFQLWVTGGRELHCVYKLLGHNAGEGWTPSSYFQGFMYKCNEL